MRWPLRFQILLPVLLLLFATVAVLTGLSFYSASRSHQQRIEADLADVSQFMSNQTFPLTSKILRDMKTLTGAEFVLLANETPVATTFSFPLPAETRKRMAELAESADPAVPISSVQQSIQIGPSIYYHRPAITAAQRQIESGRTLHILLEEDSYRRLWWQNVWPSILVGLILLPIVGLVATFLSTAVTRPLSRLQHQVEQVADGQLDPLDIGRRNDEIRDLSEAVNRMAQQLKAYQEEIRKKERLETLVDLGSGIAHHLRNSATGCRMAIQLSQMSESLADDTKENLRVALRQLALMDKYIQRFLSLDARSPSGRSEGPVDWVAVCNEVVELLDPSARHLGVQLTHDIPTQDFPVSVPLDDLEQVLMNLVTNALDAAAENASQSEQEKRRKSQVAVEFLRDSAFATVKVTDSGDGPPEEIRDSLFDSFVTRKKNGVGLGLYLTRQIVQRHGGSVRWYRTEQDQTCFEVRLPESEPTTDDPSVSLDEAGLK